MTPWFISLRLQDGGKCTRQGEYRPHTDCGKFLLCNNGNYLVQSCAPGLYWNAFTESCDHERNVDCSRSDIEAARSTSAPETSSTAAPSPSPSPDTTVSQLRIRRVCVYHIMHMFCK